MGRRPEYPIVAENAGSFHCMNEEHWACVGQGICRCPCHQLCGAKFEGNDHWWCNLTPGHKGPGHQFGDWKRADGFGPQLTGGITARCAAQLFKQPCLFKLNHGGPCIFDQISSYCSRNHHADCSCSCQCLCHNQCHTTRSGFKDGKREAEWCIRNKGHDVRHCAFGKWTSAQLQAYLDKEPAMLEHVCNRSGGPCTEENGTDHRTICGKLVGAEVCRRGPGHSGRCSWVPPVAAHPPKQHRLPSGEEILAHSRQLLTLAGFDRAGDLLKDRHCTVSCFNANCELCKSGPRGRDPDECECVCHPQATGAPYHCSVVEDENGKRRKIFDVPPAEKIPSLPSDQGQRAGSSPLLGLECFASCHLCGHRFRPNDYVRAIHVQQQATIAGLVLAISVCKSCDDGHAQTTWEARLRELKEKFWWAIK